MLEFVEVIKSSAQYSLRKTVETSPDYVFFVGFTFSFSKPRIKYCYFYVVPIPLLPKEE
jgi:hypothetical protein